MIPIIIQIILPIIIPIAIPILIIINNTVLGAVVLGMRRIG